MHGGFCHGNSPDQNNSYNYYYYTEIITNSYKNSFKSFQNLIKTINCIKINLTLTVTFCNNKINN